MRSITGGWCMKARPIDAAIKGWYYWAINPMGEWLESAARVTSVTQERILVDMADYVEAAIPEVLTSSRVHLRTDSARRRLEYALRTYQGTGVARVGKRVLGGITRVTT
jgi:hypothetical protein